MKTPSTSLLKPWWNSTAIVDNSSATDFSTVGSWPVINRNGYNGGFQYAVKGERISCGAGCF
ncbi:MAG: hypothetical protein R3C49_04525 [Planctomycetaceae bacterium]